MAGFEKDSSGYYRAWWRADGATSVFASPRDWTLPVPIGTPIPLFAFTAAPSVEAFVNGVSQGVKNVSVYGFASWPPVPFAPGSFSVTAYDASGAAVAQEKIITAGPPAALQLSLVPMGTTPLAADGADVAMVSVAVVDAAGVLVPGARNLLTYTVSKGPGIIFGLANGDPSDHTPDKVGRPDLPYGGVWARTAFMGRARAIVQTVRDTPGDITLSVAADGLPTATITFPSA